MAKKAESADTADARSARLAILRAGIEDADRRKKGEAAQRKGVGDGRSLRPNWRNGFFNVRAHPGLLEACKQAAKAKGMKLAEWVEFHMADALESEGHDTSFLTSGGSE